ncbi:LRC19 protein, partial [Stercorarius parasiticus]|nr:LRC19 protein [Stercorarius parasiticus]
LLHHIISCQCIEKSTHKHRLPLRSDRKALNMKHSWLVIWAGTLFLNPVTADCNITSQTVTCEESGKNLSDIPTDLFQNVTELSLKNNKITLKDSDRKILRSFINLTELYLNENMITVLHKNSFCNLTELVILDISNNHISTVHKAAFAGLNQLSVLNLSYNLITQLDSDVFTSLKSLTVLNLQNNLLKSFHIKSPFKLIAIGLAGNPWICSCDLLDLQIWLKDSSVTMANEDNTTCTFPNVMEKLSIKTAVIQAADCKIEKASLENTVTSTSAITVKSSALLTTLMPNNITENNGTRADLPPLGKSWTFLAGVLGFVLSTTLLIFTATKCPTWYHYLISYSHRRLEENDSEMFEQEFSADTSSPTVSGTDNEEPIVIFEKIHAFVPGEDGFIEDKYIDSYVTEES